MESSWLLKLTRIFTICLCSVFVFYPSLSGAQAHDRLSTYSKPYIKTAASYPSSRYSMAEVIESGHRFFGTAAGGLGTAIAHVFAKYGTPDAYILGEEASGAFVAGLTYGEGTLFQKYGRRTKIFWQGPSVGWDFGGHGSRLMILVYRLYNPEELWGRFIGISGSAYLLAGLGICALEHKHTILVPIRSGIGLRLGVNIGYLKLTPRPTWNPF